MRKVISAVAKKRFRNAKNDFSKAESSFVSVLLSVVYRFDHLRLYQLI